MILIGGCNDMFQKEIKDKSLESNRFKANCELNVDEFALILEEPIEEAIDCLGKNLKLFIKAVESNKPGYLSRKALESYIKRNRKDIKPEVLRVLKSVFDINFLVYGEDPDYMSDANVDALINFTKIFNEQASKNFKPVFMDEDPIEYETYRFRRDQRIKPAALIISSGLRNIFNANRNGKIHTLDLNSLLDAFTTENNEDSLGKIKKLLFLKKVALGGSKDEITHLELSRLIENFSSYVLLALDAMRSKDIRLDQESTIHLLNSDLEMLNSLVFSGSMGDRENEKLFSLREAIHAINIFDKDQKLNLDKYYDLLKEAKMIVMEGAAESITGGDLRRLFTHGLTLLKTGTFYHRFWSTERVLLESRPGRPITYDFKNLYALFRSEKNRVDSFVRILKSYRFMKGENLSAFYTEEYRRNANATFEIAIYEYAMTLLMKKYGCPNNTLDGKVVCDAVAKLNGVYLKTDHVINIVNKFRKVLIDNELIYPGREEKTAETITLLGSLFQYQSDENKVFDVNEATEFAVSLFTAIDISKDINEHFLKLQKEDKCEMDKFGRVSPKCFKENFFEAVCFNYPDQFPKLFDSLGATVYENKKLVCRIPQAATNVRQNAANLAYLNRSIIAARTCNIYPNTDEEIYYSKSDMMSIFLAMMHIETTIIRWDNRTHNNVMDPAEVMDAYNIYAPALDGFLEKMPGVVKKLKKQIYQFMVKYEQVPDIKDFGSIWKFAKFLMTFNKDATANRKTIASLLVTIGEQGAPSTFDCALLRDPDHIPDNTPTTRTSLTKRNEEFGPIVLMHDDMDVYLDVEKESDSWVKIFLNTSWPNLFP